MKGMKMDRRGFTLVELVIAVAVMAILIGATIPGVFEFIKMRDKQREQVALEEVRKAMQAYLAQNGSLPDDAIPATTPWSEALASFSKLSADQIANDTWGRPRTYVATNFKRNINNLDVIINYATVVSMGENGKATSSTGVPVSGNAFAGSSNSGWWKKLGITDDDKVKYFSDVKVPTDSDDLILKFNDYPEKLEAVNVTTQRLGKITDALESYSRANYAAWINYCGTLTRDAGGNTPDANCNNGMPERIIYSPYGKRSGALADSASYFIPTANGVATTTSVLPTSNSSLKAVVSNSNNDTTRRAEMVDLMRTLGLPDDFCCSAINAGSDNLPKPFFYFSNPVPMVGGACATIRPGASSPKYPARVTNAVPDCENP
jgi:prepilin-type N-terminal cleavage/methylation domain-containing protein